MKVNYKASTRKMDKGTFGDFKSAVNLASILSEKEHCIYRRSIAKVIDTYSKELKVLFEIKKDIKLRDRFAKDLCKRHHDLIIGRDYPDLVRNHACTVLTVYYRKFVGLKDKRKI